MQKDPRNLIVVEDEPLIAIMLMDLVEDLGWSVDGSAYNADEAFSLLAECNPKLAILDINLGQTTSLEVASVCRERGIPILFVTGYTAKTFHSNAEMPPYFPNRFPLKISGEPYNALLQLSRPRRGRQWKAQSRARHDDLFSRR